MTLGYSKPFTIAAGVVGALLVVLGLATGDTLQILPGAILVLLGVLLTINPVATIEEGELRMKNAFGMTLRRFPVAGPADLRVEGKRVVHVATGKKTAPLGFGIDARQAEQWRQWIASAPAA